MTSASGIRFPLFQSDRKHKAIFHPEWFLRYGLIGEQDAKEAKSSIVGQEIADVELCGLHLRCMQDRFSLETANVSMNEKMQDLVVNIFTLLSHTPLTACGINPKVHYQVKNEEYWHKIGDVLVPKDLIWNELFSHPGMQSITIKSPREGKFPGEINITVQPSLQLLPAKGIYIGANNHFPVPEADQHTDTTKLVLEFINTEWQSSAAIARRVGEKIFEKITD